MDKVARRWSRFLAIQGENKSGIVSVGKVLRRGKCESINLHAVAAVFSKNRAENVIIPDSGRSRGISVIQCPANERGISLATASTFYPRKGYNISRMVGTFTICIRLLLCTGRIHKLCLPFEVPGGRVTTCTRRVFYVYYTQLLMFSIPNVMFAIIYMFFSPWNELDRFYGGNYALTQCMLLALYQRFAALLTADCSSLSPIGSSTPSKTLLHTHLWVKGTQTAKNTRTLPKSEIP